MEPRNAYRILVGKPDEKRPFGRPRGGWADNIRMALKETIMRIRVGWNWLKIVQWRASGSVTTVLTGLADVKVMK